MRIAGFEFDDLTTMPGLCSSIFTQGCVTHCKGCFNEKTWPLDGGVVYTPEELVEKVTHNQIARKIAWLGGEPLIQPEDELLACVKMLHERGYTQMLYTGYTFKKLLQICAEHPDIDKVVGYMKWIKTGPWIAALASPNIKARGSSNQEIYEIKMQDNQRVYENVTAQWDAMAVGIRHVRV